MSFAPVLLRAADISSLRRQVWMAEQKAAAEQRKIDQLKKELVEERRLEEMRAHGEATGALPLVPRPSHYGSLSTGSDRRSWTGCTPGL